MLKWWCVPLYPDWINAENTIISLVTFQIQISNSKQTFVFNLPVFAAKRVFKTYQHFCFLCFHSRWCFFWFHKDREIIKNLFTVAENNFGEKQTFVHLLELWRNFICRNERGSPGRAVSLHLAYSGSQSEHRIHRVLPACGACHIMIGINIHNTCFLTSILKILFKKINTMWKLK